MYEHLCANCTSVVLIYALIAGWLQTWKTWSTRGFLQTWKIQGILCNLSENF